MSGALDSERLIDVPIESLPYVDEHSTEIAATPDEVWEALVDVVGGFAARHGGTAVARALGCDEVERSGKPGRIGSTIPGFVVARSVRPAVLALLGAPPLLALRADLPHRRDARGHGPARRRDPGRVPREGGAAVPDGGDRDARSRTCHEVAAAGGAQTRRARLTNVRACAAEVSLGFGPADESTSRSSPA